MHTLQRPIALFNLQKEQVNLAHNWIHFLPVGAVQTKEGAASGADLKENLV